MSWLMQEDDTFNSAVFLSSHASVTAAFQNWISVSWSRNSSDAYYPQNLKLLSECRNNDFCECFKTTAADPVGLLRAVVSLCWSHLVTTKNEQQRLHSTWKADETFICLWREVMIFLLVWDRDLACGACRCSSQFPKSYIWSRRRFQSKLHSSQPSAAFSPAPTPFVASGHFVHKDLPSRSRVCFHWLQSFAEAGEATSEACERCFTTTCWRMGFLSLTQRDTVRRHFRSLSEHGAPRQSLLSTNWSNPLGFVYLNETLRPWGVCLFVLILQ